MVVASCLTAATAAVAAVPTVASAAGAPTLFAGRAIGGGRDGAEIRRTPYGIPHILACRYGSLGYRYRDPVPQDNLCHKGEHLVTLRGQRTQDFGPAAGS